MKGPAEDREVVGLDAKEIEVLAADWFGRRQFWNWSEQDQVELDAWLEGALAHKVAYWRLVAAWERTERLNAVRAPMRARPAPDQSRRGWSKTTLMVTGVAAVVAIAVLGAQRAHLFRHDAAVYSTAIGETKTIDLADGSSIELNTNTVLSIDLSEGRRAVKLESGEAYFQIKHDAAHPFVVAVAGHRVTDLGTKFLVRDDVGRVRVALVEGRARLETVGSRTPARTAVLTPGDVAVATADTMTVTKRRPQALTNTLGWRRGVLVFDNTTLGDAAAEFNRYNRMQLVIADPAIARMPIAGKFPTTGVLRFADVVTHVFGLRVKTDREAMIVSR